MLIVFFFQVIKEMFKTLSLSLNSTLSLSLNSIQYVLYWHDNCYNVLPKHSVYIKYRTNMYLKNIYNNTYN